MATPAGPLPSGTIRAEIADGGLALFLAGEIDLAVVDVFERSVGGAASLPQVAVIHASETTFLAAAGVSLLLRCTTGARAAGRPPLLVRPTRHVLRPLQLVGVLDRFTIVADG